MTRPQITSLPMQYHPPCFDLWTDVGSLGHVLLGWFAGTLPASQALALFTIFTGYQISQTGSGESWPRVGGELLEFGFGMLIAHVCGTQTKTN